MNYSAPSLDIESHGTRRSQGKKSVQPSKGATGVILLLLAAFHGSPAQASEVWHTGTLRAIYPLADGSFALAFVTDAPACTAPPNPKYHYVTVGQNYVTEEASKKFYATALSAFLTGATLSIVFSDSTSMCYVNRIFFST